MLIRLLARRIIHIILLYAMLGILPSGTYQAVFARCAPEDIENGVYCGPNLSVPQPQTGNSGTPLIANNLGDLLMPIVVAAIIVGGAAIFFFAKTKELPAKI